LLLKKNILKQTTGASGWLPPKSSSSLYR